MSLVVPVRADSQISRHDKGRRGSSSNTSTESQFGTKMYLYGREICFLLAIIFTSYAALQNSSAKISSAPAAVPFFRASPHVTDYFRGQLGRAFERVSEADVSFVMYYAPWDADSQELRPEFARTAQYLHQQVHFAAINCWQPLSECRAHFPKIQAFPVLIAYAQGSKGLQYKGVREFAHMAAFLHRVLRPIERLHSTAGLVELMAKHDAVVVGFLPFRGPLGAIGFTAFHAASLRFLERDSRRDVAFAVVTDDATAKRWDVHATPAVRMFLWNETLEFPRAGALSSDALVAWVSSSLHQALAWLTPPGVKSLTLAPYAAGGGAVLVVFTPLNPLDGADPNYQALREVALEYYNCEDNPWVDDLARWLPQIRLESSIRQASLRRRCLAEPQPAEPAATITVTTAGRRDNGSQRCRRGTTLGPKLPCDLAGFVPRDATRLPTSMSDPHDARGAAALAQLFHQSECRRLSAAQAPPSQALPPGKDTPPWGVAGLACSANRTLALLAMDSRRFGHFASALGVRLGEDLTGAAVFSAEDESSFAMRAPVSARSLAEFLRVFSEGRAERSVRSSDDEPVAPNRFPERLGNECRHGPGEACVPELTSRTFNHVVMDDTKNVVVLFHSPFCSFCGAASQAFLVAARAFRAVPDLAFARVDGESNDLPWELTMHHYPTVIFFPARAKSESRVFPVTAVPTAASLSGFVLANLPSGAGLAARAGLCAASANQLAAAECVRRLRRLCLDEIEVALAEHRQAGAMWRAAQAAGLGRSALAWHRTSLRRRTRHLLFRLQHLRQVHLLLASTERLVPDGSALRAVHRSFLLYRRAMAFDQSQPSVMAFDKSKPSALSFDQSKPSATSSDQSRPSLRDQWDGSTEPLESLDGWELSAELVEELASRSEDLNAAAAPTESAGGVRDATERLERDGVEVKDDGSLGESWELGDLKAGTEESENRDVFEVKDDDSAGGRSSAERTEL